MELTAAQNGTIEIFDGKRIKLTYCQEEEGLKHINGNSCNTQLIKFISL